jgi:hypothetical protein
MIYGFAFVACLMAAVMAIPMVARVSPNVVIQGISPLPSLAAAG